MTGEPGAWSTPAPSTAYESWVRALRAWSTDPSVRLDVLPPLTDSTYDPATYSRLITHLQKSVDKLMDQWHDMLTQALSRATDEHALGRELVNLRAPLARRASLARLPNLPPQMRESLKRDVDRAVAQLQEQLEEALGDRGKGARINQSEADRLVAVARATPLTDALTMSSRPQGGAPSPAVAVPAQHAPLTAPDPDAYRRPRSSRWSHRIVDPNTAEPDGGSYA